MDRGTVRVYRVLDKRFPRMPGGRNPIGRFAVSFVSAAPEMVASAASDLSGLGSKISAAHRVAAAATTTVVTAAGDEVSAAIASLFSGHGQEFQAQCAEAVAFHDEFANLLSGGAAQYLSAEVANAEQMLVSAVNTPAQSLLGHALIGTGRSVTGVASASPARTVSIQDEPYGINGRQTVVISNWTLPRTGLGDYVASRLPGSDIAKYLTGTPIATSIGIIGSDTSGNVIVSEHVTTAGDYGFGTNVDTANKALGLNGSFPFVKASAGVNYGTGAFSGSAYVASTGGAVAVDVRGGTYAASVGTDLGGSDIGVLGQLNTNTGSFTNTESFVLPLDLGGVSLQTGNDGAYGSYTFTAVGPLGLGGGSLNGLPNGNTTWTPNSQVLDTQNLIYSMTAESNANLSNVAVNINSILPGNPISQGIDNLSQGIDNFGQGIIDLSQGDFGQGVDDLLGVNINDVTTGGNPSPPDNLTHDEQLWQNYDNAETQWDHAAIAWDSKADVYDTWLDKYDYNLEYRDDGGTGPLPYPNLGPEPPAPGPYPIEPIPPDVPDD
jgi:hypothetical protein